MSASKSLYSFRDRIACAVCNWTLKHVAGRHYRAMIGGSIRYGLRAAAMGPVEEIQALRLLEDQLREAAKPKGELLDWDLIDGTLEDLDVMRRNGSDGVRVSR